MVRRLALIIFVLFLALTYGYFTDIVIISSIFGLALGGYLALLDWQLENYSPRKLLGAGLGLSTGIIVGVYSLRAFLPTPLEFPDPFVLTVLGSFIYFGTLIGVNVASQWPVESSHPVTTEKQESTPAKEPHAEAQAKVLDTSVIIDGRIAEILELGFVEGTMVVPRFILKELQNMADSGQNLKRNRGRRGLNILNRIRDDLPIPVQIVEKDFPEIDEVDAKLVELAQEMDAKILTNDFNLNKVASLQDVNVLNINDLSNAVKPVYIPGETFEIEVIKEGEEQEQGVGYLEDGTMVVIEDAITEIGNEIPVTVTSVIQTSAGRMIFAEKGKENALE